MLSWVAAFWLSLAPVPPAEGKLPLAGVERVFQLDLGKHSTPPIVRYLPGRVGFQLDLAVDVDTARTLVDDLPYPYLARLEPAASGTRIQLVHPSDVVRAQTHSDRKGASHLVEFGIRSEDLRLRWLGSLVRRPLPEPTDLGAFLELWQDAERATNDGELELARRLWEKLQQTSHLDDLAALRVAELYIISGHVNEASARLRQVSRRYPRSTGASLARLDLLHIETLTNVQRASLEQIDVASETIDRRKFESFAQLRAALILDELGETALALSRMPPPQSLPAAWRGPAELEVQRILERAIATPVWRGNPLGTISAWTTWGEQLNDHPHRSEIVDAVIEAYARLELFEPAINLIRSRLRELPAAIDEAVLITRLAQAYHDANDLPRQAEVLTFAYASHPRVPELLPLTRGYVLQAHGMEGLAAARSRLSDLRAVLTSESQRNDFGELEADLVLAYGDAAAQAQVLSNLQALGFRNPALREPQLALAWVRSGRPAEAAPLLRQWAGRTTDPEARDKLTYNLALCEFELDHEADAVKILELLARAGTHYGLIARAHLKNRELEGLLASASITTKPSKATR